MALGLAGLAALGVHALRPRLRPAALVAGAALVAVACWPLARGVGLDRQLGLPDGVPAAWRGAAHDLDRTLPRGQRAMVLPGQLFGFYDWGGTYDPILPALTDRPVAVRFIVPFADLRAVDLQWTTDALVSQQRAVPGQLRPLLDLMGVGAVVQGADDDRARSGAAAAPAAAAGLRALGAPARAYGPLRTVPGTAGTLEPAARLPQVRRWNLPTGGMVRVLPRDPTTVVDGSAQAIADLAGFGALRTDRALRYAADLDPAQLRGAGGTRRVVRHQRLQPPPRLRRRAPARQHRLDVGRGRGPLAGRRAARSVPARGSDAQTVAVLGGVASVRADFSPGFAQFPERRPFAAIDGDPSTAWLADRSLATERHQLDVRFPAPRDVDHVDLLPYSDSRGRVDRVAVNGREFAVREGWNRLPLRLRGVRAPERADRARRPAADRRGRGGRHPRAAHPGRAGDRGAAPAGPGRARAARRRPEPLRADLPVRPHHRRRPRPPARRHGRPAARPRPRPAGRRARLDARHRAAGGAGVARRRLGQRRCRDPRPRLRSLDRGALLPGAGPSKAPRASRASGATAPRRRSTAIRGAPGSPAGSARAARGCSGRAARRGRSARCASCAHRCACGSRPACASSPTAGAARRWRSPATARWRCPRRCARARCASRSSTPPSRRARRARPGSGARWEWGRWSATASRARRWRGAGACASAVPTAPG